MNFNYENVCFAIGNYVTPIQIRRMNFSVPRTGLYEFEKGNTLCVINCGKVKVVFIHLPHVQRPYVCDLPNNFENHSL